MPLFFERRTHKGTLSSANPAEVWTDWQGKNECWLFTGAHDDDIVIGAGLTLLAGLADNVSSFAAYFTNGIMGYCSPEQRRDIVSIRQDEADRSFAHIGLLKENLYRFNYDDGNLMLELGRRFADSNNPNERFGAVGLENDMTWLVRKVKPTRVFLPNHRDLHPDHRAVHMDLVMSIFHAQGEIWPELGEPIAAIPKLYEYATYSGFELPPTMRIHVPEEMVCRRFESVAMYQSQRQIGLTVEELRKVGGVEYLLEMEFDLIHREQYALLF